jgi:hypothetical protein
MARKDFEAKWQDSLLFVIHNQMDRAKFNVAAEWRVTPRAPLGQGIGRASMMDYTLPKMGPGDF